MLPWRIMWYGVILLLTIGWYETPLRAEGPPAPAPTTGFTEPFPRAILPVLLVPAISAQPALDGEVFFLKRFSLDYRDGPLWLAGNAEGTASYSIDDQILLTITHTDGTTHFYESPREAGLYPPFDASPYFHVGINQVEVKVRDLWGGVEASTEVWLTNQSAPSLPLPDPAIAAVPLHLPVHLAPDSGYRPSGPEVFYTARYTLDYRGGPVTLATDAAGTRDFAIDDQLIMHITHPDGTQTQYQTGYVAEWVAPVDLTAYFQVGLNAIEIELHDHGGIARVSDLWLSDRPPSTSPWPVEVFAGVVPTRFWSGRENLVTVTRPKRRSVFIAGDPTGRQGTWVTGNMHVTVHRADGLVKRASYTYDSLPQHQGTLPPIDITDLLGRGPNRVGIYLEAGAQEVTASSPIWLVAK